MKFIFASMSLLTQFKKIFKKRLEKNILGAETEKMDGVIIPLSLANAKVVPEFPEITNIQGDAMNMRQPQQHMTSRRFGEDKC